MNPTPNMMPKTRAQITQQGNRNTAGEYQAKTSADPIGGTNVLTVVDPDKNPRGYTAAIDLLTAQYPEVESISFRVEEDWDNTDFEDTEVTPFRVEVIDVILRDGTEIDGDEYESAEAMAEVLTGRLSQSALYGIYESGRSKPAVFNTDDDDEMHIALDDTLAGTPQADLESRTVAEKLHEEFPGLKSVTFRIDQGYDVDGDYFQPRYQDCEYEQGNEPDVDMDEEIEATIDENYSAKVLQDLCASHPGTFSIGLRR